MMLQENGNAMAQELADALVSVLGSDSEPGLLDKDRAERFRRCVYARSRALDILGLQAVRLAGLMQAADPRGYWNFLYRLPRLQARHFRHALDTARKLGRFQGRYEIEDKSVVFLSAADGFRGGGFTLSFNQMPYAGAFLDLLHNSLGLADVQRMLAPLCAPTPEASLADRIAADLRKAFELWLKDRLESEYHIRQSQAIGQYLQGVKSAQARFFHRENDGGNREMVEVRLGGRAVDPVGVTDWHRTRWPSAYALFRTTRREAWSDPEDTIFARRADLVQDETIVSFWLDLVTSNSALMDQIGFRRYRSVAHGVLLYKYALDRSAQEHGITQAISLTLDEGDEFELDTSGRKVDRNGNRDTEDRNGSYDVEIWVSPLSVLVAPPCDAVKWLSGTDVDFLGGIIPGGSKKQPSLFGENRPDPRFAETLMRHLYFGEIQEMAINNAGKTAFALPDTNGYETAASKLARLSVKTRELAYATVQALLKRRDTAALILLHHLEPGIVAELGRAAGGRFGLADVEMLLKTVMEGLAVSGNATGSRIRASYKNTDRTGFRDRDADDPDFDEALNAGADIVAALHAELERVAGWYAAKDLSKAYAADAARFEIALKQLYGRAVETDLPAAGR